MPTPAERLTGLLVAEDEGTLPGTVAFWSEAARADRPGPWVLSQWYAAPFEVDGVRYATAEAYMMAEKARLFDDADALAAVLAATHPAVAKKAGRLVTPFDSTVWDAHRYDVVVRGNVAKFSAHDDLRRYLLSTAPKVLVEASPFDRVWGIGAGPDDLAVGRPARWRGRNLLGFALMDVRDLLA